MYIHMCCVHVWVADGISHVDSLSACEAAWLVSLTGHMRVLHVAPTPDHIQLHVTLYVASLRFYIFQFAHTPTRICVYCVGVMGVSSKGVEWRSVLFTASTCHCLWICTSSIHIAM
jgi:hypothetical protein